MEERGRGWGCTRGCCLTLWVARTTEGEFAGDYLACETRRFAGDNMHVYARRAGRPAVERWSQRGRKYGVLCALLRGTIVNRTKYCY